MTEEPPLAASVAAAVDARFGARRPLIERFVAELATSAVERGLIGPREVPRLWDRHILNCAVLADLLPDGARVVDVGSGAGLPGLVLAVARPDLALTLVEPLLRRVTWLEGVISDLGLGSVTVVRGRAEEQRGFRGAFDVATARAVASLDTLSGWCLPLVRQGGELLALKGVSAEDELAAAEDRLTQLGAVSWEVVVLGAGELDQPTRVIRVVAGSRSSAPERAQRRVRRGGRD